MTVQTSQFGIRRASYHHHLVGGMVGGNMFSVIGIAVLLLATASILPSVQGDQNVQLLSRLGAQRL